MTIYGVKYLKYIRNSSLKTEWKKINSTWNNQ